MNVLKALESKIAGLVEGTFGRVFRSEVRPVELARKLAREMDEHRTISISRVYAPNEYTVWLSPGDRERYDGVEDEVIEELVTYLLEHARERGLALASQPVISFQTDARLRLGEFGIQARLVRESATTGGDRPLPPLEQAEAGQTMIYAAESVESRPSRRRARAAVSYDGKRVALPVGGATIGRSRDCEVVIDDSGVSRHHAEIAPAADGWYVADLGSTNGTLVDGHLAREALILEGGEVIEVGSTRLLFELT
jgi:hypothetical protein